MRCIRAGPDFVDDPDRYRGRGADLLELPLEQFPGVNPGKLRLLADRAGLRTLATVERLEGPGRGLLERAVLARLDQVGLPLETDVESRGRLLALARRHGVRAVLSHRSERPPRSAESVLRVFQKSARAGGDLGLVSFQVSRAEHVRFLREASRAAAAQNIARGISATGNLSALVSLIACDLVFGSLDGSGGGLDIGALSRVGHSTRLFAILGEPAHPTAPLEVLDALFLELGLDCACIQLGPGPDGPGALAGLLRDMGFSGFLVGRPFRSGMASLVPAPGGPACSVSVVTLRNGDFVGRDTDGAALLGALDGSGVRVQSRRAVVLGTGGAARSAARALRSSGARVAIAGRSLRRALEAAGAAGAEAAPLSAVESLLARSSLLVNAIPAHGAGLVPDSALRSGLVVVDLDCSPGAPDLLRRAAESGAHTVGGMAVLRHNLAEALRLFTGARPPGKLVGRLLDESLGRDARTKKKS